MIFAVVDALHYFRRTGPYSDSTLRAQGLLPAAAENFPNWMKWPLGHILFVSTAGSLVSWLIMYVSSGVMSHTAMVYGDGILNDVTSVGVHRRPISDYFDGRSYMCVVPPPKGTDLEFAKQFMDRALGARYNYVGVIRLGFHILIGNNHSFSWKAVADILVILAATGSSIWLYTQHLPRAILLVGALYAALVILNRWRWRNRPVELSRREA